MPPDLLSFEYTRTRRNDPQTSRDAAKSVVPVVSDIQARVLRALQAAGHNGLTDEELSNKLGCKGSTARTRRSELVEKGFVLDSGYKRPLESRKLGAVWIAIDTKEAA